MATKKPEKTVTETENTDNILDLNEAQNAINQLRQDNEELKQQLQLLLDSLNAKKTTTDITLPEEESYEEDYPEPALNKNIKVVSLFYGSLNLSDGLNAKLSFSQYGQAKNCLYGKLIDIVNHDIKFAKGGYFYIADKAAVYHLGLSDDYKHIQPKEVLDNICKYDDSIIKSIGTTLTDEQKDSVAFGIAKRMYDGETFDFNKIKVLSDAIGINIENLCQEMHDTERKNSLNTKK